MLPRLLTCLQLRRSISATASHEFTVNKMDVSDPCRPREDTVVLCDGFACASGRPPLSPWSHLALSVWGRSPLSEGSRQGVAQFKKPPLSETPRGLDCHR